MAKDFKSFFATVEGGEGNRCNYPTRLDTYGCGCSHSCNYCFARSLLEFRGLWNPDDPAVASTDYISRKLSKVKPGTILRLGGMTDCSVREVYVGGERNWRAPRRPLTARELTDAYVGHVKRRRCA